MRIAIVTDAWLPQINGVVRSLSSTVEVLRDRGHELLLVTPDQFRTIPCPSYPEIRLAVGCRRGVARQLENFQPDAVHLATEGPLGWAARRWCLGKERPFTTSFHTRFPDYVALRTRLSPNLFWPIIRRFHAPSRRVMVATQALAAELTSRRFARVSVWPLGIDPALFNAGVQPDSQWGGLPRPVLLNVGRVAVEKNIAAFLDADVPGTKVVIGDGPAREQLMRRYPSVHFPGALSGQRLAAAYAAADVFVFPSRTDTLGLVNLEALAVGLPIAAFPVRGPLDVLGVDGTGMNGGRERIGVTHENLEIAIRSALELDRAACAREGALYGWARCTDLFEAGLVLRNGAKAFVPPARSERSRPTIPSFTATAMIEAQARLAGGPATHAA